MGKTLHSLPLLVCTGAVVALSACSPAAPPPVAPPPVPSIAPIAALRPIASIQELMRAEVDRSADGVWNAVATISTVKGVEERRPKTPQEWEEVRLSAIALIEAANLLVMEGRRVGAKDFAAEAAGALDSKQIQALLDSKRPVFNSFAGALREAGVVALAAIDAKDPAALEMAGGGIETVCEGCHLTFWYPNQVIPPFPEKDQAGTPIRRYGTANK
jgi:hypothetical protein